MRRTFVVLILLSGCATLSAGPVATISAPSGSLTGNPGDTIHWDFTIDNSTGPYYLFATESDLCVSGIPSPCITSALGSYSDNLQPSPVVVPPGFAMIPPGPLLGSFTFALPGTLTGSLFITFSEYTADPNASNFDPSLDTIASNLTFDVDVSSGTAAPLPEPASTVLICAGLLVLAKISAKRSRG